MARPTATSPACSRRSPAPRSSGSPSGFPGGIAGKAHALPVCAGAIARSPWSWASSSSTPASTRRRRRPDGPARPRTAPAAPRLRRPPLRLARPGRERGNPERVGVGVGEGRRRRARVPRRSARRRREEDWRARPLDRGGRPDPRRARAPRAPSGGQRRRDRGVVRRPDGDLRLRRGGALLRDAPDRGPRLLRLLARTAARGARRGHLADAAAPHRGGRLPDRDRLPPPLRAGRERAVRVLGAARGGPYRSRPRTARGVRAASRRLLRRGASRARHLVMTTRTKGEAMAASETPGARFARIGLWLIPVYGALLAVGTI